jgi:hypothetical protein
MSCDSIVQAFSQVYTNTKNDLFKIGRMPKNAENDDFLSKFPGIGSDLSVLMQKCTYFDNLMTVSVNDQICFYMSCFCMWLDKELFWINVQCDCFQIIND